VAYGVAGALVTGRGRVTCGRVLRRHARCGPEAGATGRLGSGRTGGPLGAGCSSGQVDRLPHLFGGGARGCGGRGHLGLEVRSSGLDGGGHGRHAGVLGRGVFRCSRLRRGLARRGRQARLRRPARLGCFVDGRDCRVARRHCRVASRSCGRRRSCTGGQAGVGDGRGRAAEPHQHGGEKGRTAAAEVTIEPCHVPAVFPATRGPNASRRVYDPPNRERLRVTSAPRRFLCKRLQVPPRRARTGEDSSEDARLTLPNTGD
jgi:hypothetical protein